MRLNCMSDQILIVIVDEIVGLSIFFLLNWSLVNEHSNKCSCSCCLDDIKYHILAALYFKVCASDNEIENVILKDLSLKFSKLYSRVSH